MRSAPVFTFMGLFGLLLAERAAAAPDKVRAPATLAVTPTPAPGAARPGDGQAPIANDTAGSGRVNTASSQALIQDVASSFDQMEKNIEKEYAKLIHDARAQKSALEEKIKEIDRQIAALKEQAKKLEQVAAKMEQINARIDSLNKENAALRARIAALDKQIAKLDQDKAKAIADLRKQKQKALADATKASDARLIRVPTPTPKK